MQNLFVIIFLVLWLFTTRQAVFGQLDGTFIQTRVPTDYVQFKNFLSSDPQFSRILWIPEKQRFGYWSDTHPAVWSYDFFHTASLSGPLVFMKDATTEHMLQESSVKYIVVPLDSQKEIFLTDRKYDQKQYINAIHSLDKISWLTKRKNFGDIAVYEITNSKQHFWSESNNLHISYAMDNPTHYVVSLKNAQKGERIIFSESFARSWVASIGTTNMRSEIYDGHFNSFILTKDGDYTIDVRYSEQKLVNAGLAISLVTFLFAVGCLFVIRKKRKK